MSSFGRSKANNWNGEGEVKNPAVTATTRSASPNRFHAETRSALSRGPTPIRNRDDRRENPDKDVAETGRPGE